jgi:hypothetical protein
MCEEPVLDEVYIFIKELLEREFCNIYHSVHETKLNELTDQCSTSKGKKSKTRKRIIIVDSNTN